jgi:hypothetical protein
MKKGWSVFSNLCKGFRGNNGATSDNQRQVEFRDVETRMGMEGNLPKISHENQNPVTTAVTTVLGGFQNTDTDVNAHIILELKLELTRGHNGLWTVSKAEVENKAHYKEPVRGLKQIQQQYKKQAGPTKVWKPKPAPLKLPNGASQGLGVGGASSSLGQKTRDVENSGTFTSASESEAKGVIVPIPDVPCVEILAPPSTEGVDRLWGSSSAWMLELRDGRRVSIPLSLLRMPVTIDTEEKDSEEGATSHGGSELDSESEAVQHGGMLTAWGDDEEADDEVSVVWEDPPPSAGEGKLICWEDENKPLEVALLAIAGPDVDEMITGDVSAPKFEQVSGIKLSPSEWVQETMKEFGVVLGASYEGYEEQLMSMLQEIESRRNP